MKFLKFSIFFSIFFLSVNLFSQMDYNIRLKINTLEDSVIYIKSVYGKKTIVLDTLIKQKDGLFYLNKKNLKQGIIMVCLKHDDLFSFLLDKNTNFYLEVSPTGYTKVEGCDANDIYFEYQRANMEFRMAESEIRQALSNNNANKDSLMSLYSNASIKFNNFQQEFYESYPDHIMTILVKSLEEPKLPEKYYKGRELDTTKVDEIAYYYKSHFWDNFRFDDIRILSTPYFFNKLKAYIEDLTQRVPDSITSSLRDFVIKANSVKNGKEYSKYAVNYYLDIYKKFPFSWHEENFVCMVDKLISPELTPWIMPHEIEIYKKEVDRLRQIIPGKKFPNIKSKTLEGEAYSLYDIKKKYTVIYFFSASCGSCEIDLDKLEDFYRVYKDTYDFEVISIDLDYNKNKSRDFAKERPFHWIPLQSNFDDINNQFGLDISQTPDLYIVDIDKKILYHAPKYQTIIEYIEKSEEFSKIE